jgi:hypothetical protein
MACPAAPGFPRAVSGASGGDGGTFGNGGHAKLTGLTGDGRHGGQLFGKHGAKGAPQPDARRAHYAQLARQGVVP